MPKKLRFALDQLAQRHAPRPEHTPNPTKHSFESNFVPK
jgi:hypothetical protein